MNKMIVNSSKIEKIWQFLIWTAIVKHIYFFTLMQNFNQYDFEKFFGFFERSGAWGTREEKIFFCFVRKSFFCWKYVLARFAKSRIHRKRILSYRTKIFICGKTIFLCRAKIFFDMKRLFWVINICIFSDFVSFLIIRICILSENALGGQFANFNCLKKCFASEFTFVFSQKTDEAKKTYLHFLRNSVGRGKLN